MKGRQTCALTQELWDADEVNRWGIRGAVQLEQHVDVCWVEGIAGQHGCQGLGRSRMGHGTVQGQLNGSDVKATIERKGK